MREERLDAGPPLHSTWQGPATRQVSGQLSVRATELDTQAQVQLHDLKPSAFCPAALL